VDVLVVNLNEPPSLLRNDVSDQHHWLKVKLIGVTSKGSAIGARVTVRYRGKLQTQEVLSQSIFYSVNDFRLHFGLGNATVADVDVRWPSEARERMANVSADQLVFIREGSGIVKAERFGKGK
jgi:hypothetical protein